MIIKMGTGGQNNADATNAVTVSSIPISNFLNRGLLVATAAFKTGDPRIPSSVTYNGVSMTNIAGATITNAGGADVGFWFLDSPAPATANVVCTYPTTMENISVFCLPLYGVKTGNPDNFNESDVSVAVRPISISITPTVVNCLLFSIVNTTTSGGNVPGANQVKLGGTYSDFIVFSYSGAVNPVGAKTHSYDNGGVDTSPIAIVSISPQPGGSYRPNQLRPSIFVPGVAR